MNMKIPDSAVGPLLQMVTKSLPYSGAHIPITPESKAAMNILIEVADSDENLTELEGFIFYLGEKIDKSPEMQKSTKKRLSRLITILQEYEKDVSHLEV